MAIFNSYVSLPEGKYQHDKPFLDPMFRPDKFWKYLKRSQQKVRQHWKRSEDWRQWLILVGGIPTPLKNDGVRQMGLLFPIYGKSSKPCSKPPTSYTPWSTMNNPQGIVRWVSHINGPWIGGCPIATFDDQVGRKVVVWYARNTATLGKTARFRTTWLIMGPWGPWWATGGQKNWWKSLRSLTQPLSLHVTWQLGWLQDN